MFTYLWSRSVQVARLLRRPPTNPRVVEFWWLVSLLVMWVGAHPAAVISTAERKNGDYLIPGRPLIRNPSLPRSRPPLLRKPLSPPVIGIIAGPSIRYCRQVRWLHFLLIKVRLILHRKTIRLLVNILVDELGVLALFKRWLFIGSVRAFLMVAAFAEVTVV